MLHQILSEARMEVIIEKSPEKKSRDIYRREMSHSKDFFSLMKRGDRELHNRVLGEGGEMKGCRRIQEQAIVKGRKK
ncbi:hypothetical protein CEXT_85721 [Caerostris extrusa]|uniref:Uncharacterized protein n=1 Tax=Caerostris extrusa TaxID=172846 RepID=A0AAV4WB04_CAEEX|nr:hypothetical protein CEXT_85721 [Caerostris extrusa]